MFDKNQEASKLAAAHYRVESGITQIFRLYASTELESRPDEPIKLLEVNEDTIASGVMPLGFGPAPDQGIHFPSVVVEVTPDEFNRICSRELALPDGWTIGTPLPRSSTTAVA